MRHANVTRLMRAHGLDTYEALLDWSTEDVARFWDAALQDLGLEWYAPYESVMDDSDGIAWTRWFLGGRTNIALNCLDRWVRDGEDERTALLWEGDGGETRERTYGEIDEESRLLAGFLRSEGVGPGDAVALYMPMVPEIVSVLMACFKVGAAAVPVFSGFGAEALAARLADAEVKVLFTADGGMRRGKAVDIKPAADRALRAAPSVERVVLLRRTGDEVPRSEGRDLDWDEALRRGAEGDGSTAELEAEARSLVLYTSGTTGKPKGCVHTHAGAMAQVVKELAYAFDVRKDSRFFWLSDIGWMMGPWEIIGVMSLGGAFLMFEGAPNWPDPGRLWSLVERHRLSHLGVAPTAVRLLMASGDEYVDGCDLSTLRILGSTGEPWDPDSWSWYFEKVGGGRCPVINISGGTEIIGCLLSPLPITDLKPTTLRGPGLGMDVDVVDEDGRPVRGGIGHLVCRKPAPSMTKGFLGDPQRYLDTYFSRFEGIWYHGDWAQIDEDGFWFLHGRSDDVIKVAGKRLGPAEVEAALVEDADVSEAAAVGVPDELKGEVPVCFVVLAPGREPSEELRSRLLDRVADALGKPMRPKEIRFTEALPKTRSAKIVRGLIRKAYLGEEIGDTASVENPEAIDAIRETE